jgi:hypothetical protein
MKKRQLLIFLFVFMLLTLKVVNAVKVESAPDGRKIFPDRVNETIKIDGVLNEKVWKNKGISEEFTSFYPVFGEVKEQKTTVWLAYDSENIFFAFHCYDPEPQKIKSTITQRDRIFRDDLVGIMLDAVGNKQTSYEFYVNADGIQADAVNSASSGTNVHPDFVWQSAGKFTEQGYDVEICIPLKSINYKSGEEVQMRMLFVRQISRLGTGISWPKIKPGQTDFNSMATAYYKNLKTGLKLEVLPNFTYSWNKTRANDAEWGNSETPTNVGAAVKYGVTSSITAEVTVNPDFSQVESDAYQVEVNRRYPVFQTEKRPFFMEGMKTFDFGLTLINDIQIGSMGSAIHTRRIVDPGWAAKLTGSAGKLNFGILTANDQSPEQTWGDISAADQGKDAYWGIVRGKYNLGSDNVIGLLYSGSYFGDNKNHTLGLDLQYRLSKYLRLYLNYLHTDTKYASDLQDKKGGGFNTILQHISPKFEAWALYERYDEEFNMNSAFMNRVGISRGKIFVGPNIYTKIKGLKGLKKVQPWFLYKRLKDLGTGMYDTGYSPGVNFYFHGLGVMEWSYHDEEEAWQGQIFRQKFFHFWLYTQVCKWFQTQIFIWVGDQIYYDTENPFLGKGPRGIFEFTIEPIQKLRLRLEWTFNKLSRKSDNEKIYSVNVVNFRTTYQFNRHFFLRGAVRYDDYEKKLLTDFLASFTLIPGTVLHLGYGSLYENKVWQNSQWLPGQGNHLLNMRNSLFFKVSYLWRIK